MLYGILSLLPSEYSSETVVCNKYLNTSVRVLSRGLTLGNLRGYWVASATARLQSIDINCIAKVPTPVLLATATLGRSI